MRHFDIILSSIALLVLMPCFLVIYIFIKLTDKGPVLHWSKRIGLMNQEFKMPKFRTMKVNTPQLASHLIQGQSKLYITPVGSFLRRTSLDELPQLFSILKGDMSIVGPRPALFNQFDLIEQRTKVNIHTLKPGLTGWAQINGRDEISIEEKVKYDEYYLKNKSFLMDFRIIIITLLSCLKAKGITH